MKLRGKEVGTQNESNQKRKIKQLLGSLHLLFKQSKKITSQAAGWMAPPLLLEFKKEKVPTLKAWPYPLHDSLPTALTILF